jgi:hypothetical protein
LRLILGVELVPPMRARYEGFIFCPGGKGTLAVYVCQLRGRLGGSQRLLEAA